RSQSRARLERGDPGQRIAGAWREVTDALRLAGRPIGDDLTAGEVAERAARVIVEARATAAGHGPTRTAEARAVVGSEGTSPLAGDAAQLTVDGPDPPAADVTELAGLLNRVAFAPGTATPEQAERAAVVADGYVSALRAARPWWRRLLWSVHPGPLHWRR
ncbi:MAG: transglutaminase domain-containing protein, partial [Micromonospora sp.]